MLQELLILATVCFVGLISPGPDFFLVAKNSVIYPRRQALATAFGIVAGNVIAATYCVMGLAVVIAQSVLLFSIIRYAGAAYLIYIGLKGILSGTATPHTDEPLLRTKLSVSTRKAFIEGLLCNLLNPKLGIFLLSIFTQLLPVDASLKQKLLFAAVFAGEALIYFPAMVLILQSRVISSSISRMQAKIDRVFGAILLALGVRIALSDN